METDIEVLNFAATENVETTTWRLGTQIGISAGAGLVVLVFVAFILEFVTRTKQTGRMEPILNELRGDALFGWIVRRK